MPETVLRNDEKVLLLCLPLEQLCVTKSVINNRMNVVQQPYCIVIISLLLTICFKLYYYRLKKV